MKTSEPKTDAESTHSWTPKSLNDNFFSFNQAHKNSFFGPATIQPTLKIGKPEDQYEKQADQVADKVVQMPNSAEPIQRQALEEEEEMVQVQAIDEEKMLQTQPLEEEEELQMKREPILQKKCKECEEAEKLQMKNTESSKSGDTISETISTQLQSMSGSGNVLPPSIQKEMSQKIGADFSRVNIHTDSEAARISQTLVARAFTHGSDIYFNSGEYRPQSTDGKRLLAHELAHVIQQKNAKRNGITDLQKKENENKTADIEIYFNAFIPGSLGTWLDEPGTPHCEFKTDDRNFGEKGSSRISQAGHFTVSNLDGITNCDTTSDIGESHRRCYGYVPPTLDYSHRRGGLVLDQGGLRYTYSSDKATDKGSTNSKCNKSSATFHLIGEAAYPFLPGPDIDFDVTIDVYKSGSKFSVEGSGERNNFPAYELVVVNTNKRNIIYKYTPTDDGPGVLNLNTSSNFQTVTTTFDI